MSNIDLHTLRLFYAGRLAPSSDAYRIIEADLAADPEDGEVAQFLKRLERFTSSELDVNWGILLSISESEEDATLTPSDLIANDLNLSDFVPQSASSDDAQAVLHQERVEYKNSTSPDSMESFSLHAAEYLRMDLTELRSKLAGYDKAYRSGDPLAPYRAELRELICEGWNWNAHRDDPSIKDESAMVGTLALVISESDIPFPFPAAMIAALLVREGLDNLCNPFR